MERAVQGVLMALFILIHPFFDWSVAENDVGIVHVGLAEWWGIWGIGVLGYFIVKFSTAD
jgi:hypothetical protein